MKKTPIKTVTQIEKAMREATVTTPYPIAGCTGLELNIRVNTTGGKVADFRHRYTHPVTGKRHYMTLGRYPALTLEQAKKGYSDNLATLAQGLDPIEKRDMAKRQEKVDRLNVMQHFINEWMDRQKSKGLAAKTLSNQARIVRIIEQEYSNMRVTDIKPSHVIQFIKRIQQKSSHQGIEVKGILKSILQIAKANGVIENNPASDLNQIVKPHKKTHHPAITEPAAFGQLLREIDTVQGQLYQREVLQLLALTFARVGDICAMRWVDIDLEARRWAFAPQKSGKRDDMMASVIIPLSDQVLAILGRMHRITGHTARVFHNSYRKKGDYTDPQQINKLLNSPMMNDGKSYKDIHSPHGFRASAKTMLMERLGYDELITELSLGHRMLNKYGKAYNRADHIDQRMTMMQAWADYLEDLREGGGKLLHFNAAARARAAGMP